MSANADEGDQRAPRQPRKRLAGAPLRALLFLAAAGDANGAQGNPSSELAPAKALVCQLGVPIPYLRRPIGH